MSRDHLFSQGTADLSPTAIRCRREAISLKDLQKLTLSPEVVLLGRMIVARSIGMLYGPRGSGKSLLATLIAYAIAGGKQLSPWGVGAGAVVCYLDGEMRIRGFRDRLSQVEVRDPRETTRERAGNNFFVVSRDLLGDTIGSIDTDEGQRAIDALLPASLQFLVIDNLSAWTNGGEDIKSWQAIKQWLIKKRLSGVAVLLLHHSGKSGSQRGTSSHEDLLDYSLKLTPVTVEDQPDRTAFALEHTKLRDHLPELRGDHLFTFWTEDGRMQFTTESSQSKVEGRVAQMLELRDQGKSQADIARELGVSPSMVSRTLSRFRTSATEQPSSEVLKHG